MCQGTREQTEGLCSPPAALETDGWQGQAHRRAQQPALWPLITGKLALFLASYLPAACKNQYVCADLTGLL